LSEDRRVLDLKLQFTEDLVNLILISLANISLLVGHQQVVFHNVFVVAESFDVGVDCLVPFLQVEERLRS
jgi:hypothetical protein